MQLSSIQHVQSMAATMAELTHQNQELTREINLRRQRHEGLKDRPKVKKVEEMLSPKTSKGCHFTEGVALGEGDGPNEEGHGRDEGEHKKGEPRRRFSS